MDRSRPTMIGAFLFEVCIERLAYGGDSIAHLDDGRIAFIRDGVPGDRALVEIDEDKGRFVRGHVTKVIEPSPERTEPKCPYFGQCGGCTWQHIAYEAQTNAKRAIVVDSLRRIGGVENADALVSETICSPLEYGYRNKIELVTDTSRPRLTLGFHRRASDEVWAVEECWLLPKKYRSAPRALAGALRYAAGTEDLGINRVGLRVAAHTRDVEPAIWTSPGSFPRQTVARTINSALPTTSLVRVLSKGEEKARRVSGVEVLSGRGNWRERLGDLEYAISAPSFFQVNTKAAELLVSAVIDKLGVNEDDRVLDLYSGAGTFTVPLSLIAGEVVAVESAGSAVRDLRRNLESAATWADVIGGDAARELPELGTFDVVVVDPPRSGLAPESVDALIAAHPRRIAYVSCDPTTLARDLKLFATGGYQPIEAIPVDLFPQTYHIETVCLLQPAG